MKTETEFLRHQLEQARRFIHGMRSHANGYGSTFSEGVFVDCDTFLRDTPSPKPSTHVVITRAYLKRLQECALERLTLQRQLKQMT